MTIEEAKNYIKNDIRIYLMKDEYGSPRIPVARQRPIFLLGAPGIGKTAIMEQIAGELGIALVAYSMTHHTRQSALGLPFIKHESFEGMEYDVTEYTMSEIIASIYEVMRTSGIKEGILFLDEINCVSETLAPSMLQFLQYKTFGKHKVPEGWIIVTAGNPPEYNKSVREMDVVTMDRLKVLNVEADYETWKKYAREHKLHSAVLGFLEIHKDYFYHIEMTIKGRTYVTARGWEDLSSILTLYTEKDMPVDEKLIGQYIRNDKIVREFAAYYDLYRKYQRDYQIEEILSGNPDKSVYIKGKNADFDERLSVLGMLTDRILNEISGAMSMDNYLSALMKHLKKVKEVALAGDGRAVMEKLSSIEAKEKMKLESLAKANSLSDKDKAEGRRIIEFMQAVLRDLSEGEYTDGESSFAVVRKRFDKEVAEMKAAVENVKLKIHNVFDYIEKAYDDGNELLIFVTELTVNNDSAAFISSFGVPEYREASEKLLLTERRDTIKDEINELII